MAWLHARPKTSESDKEPLSRYERLGGDDPLTEMPDGDSYIISAWHQSGLVGQGGMSISPISWAELESFSRMTGTHLTGWEAEQVVLMSRSYVSFARKAEVNSCEAPYQRELTKAEIIARGMKMKEALSRSAKRGDAIKNKRVV